MDGYLFGMDEGAGNNQIIKKCLSTGADLPGRITA
jgi:hypothetical protein